MQLTANPPDAAVLASLFFFTDARIGAPICLTFNRVSGFFASNSPRRPRHLWPMYLLTGCTPTTRDCDSTSLLGAAR